MHISQESEAKFREWAMAEHPTVLSLAPGRATIVISEFGPQWFGPEDGEVEVSGHFYRREVLGERTLLEDIGAPKSSVEWPPMFDYGPFRLVFVPRSESGDGMSVRYVQGRFYAEKFAKEQKE